MKDLFLDSPGSGNGKSNKIEKVYQYVDENGILIYEVVRTPTKNSCNGNLARTAKNGNGI